MNKRECLLSKSWTGEPLTLGDRELVLSAGRFELLRYWKNAIMAESATDQTEIGALHEIAWVMWMTGPEVKAAKRMTLEKRREAVLDFALDNEDELTGIEDGIKDRLMAIKAATVEAESPGKELVHAS
jgi:hypothetical protein